MRHKGMTMDDLEQALRMLANAPAREGFFFKVPKIIE